MKKATVNIYHIQLVLLFMASMNFVGRFFYLFVACFLVTVMNKKHCFAINAFSIFTLICGFSLCLFSSESNSLTNLIKPFVYCMCAFIGANILVSCEIKEARKRLTQLLISLGAGSSIHLLLNMLYNKNTVLYRNTVDIWSKEALGATAQASLGIIAMAIAIACVMSDCSKKSKIISWTAIVLILSYNLVLAGRTLLVIFLVIFAVSFLSVLVFEKDKKNTIKIVLIVIAIIAIALFMYSNNTFGIKDTVESSTLYGRFFAKEATMKLDQDSRMDNKQYFLKNLNMAVWGGGKIRNSRGVIYAHDLLMDGMDEGGIFTLIFLILMLFESIKNLCKYVFSSFVDFHVKQIVLCLSVAFFLEFTVEPILIGYQCFFAQFCMFESITISYYKLLEESVHEEDGRYTLTK